MSIIIRLQNLPLSASSLDIRRFFGGLTIPDGGVHIIGGEFGDAFIAFSSDEDARQAMNRENDSLIKDCKVKLFLSSRNEMKQVIDKARNQNLSGLNKTKSSSSNQSTTTNTITSTKSLNSLGNGNSQTIRTDLNKILNSNNLSPTIKTDKLTQSTIDNSSTINQINYSSLNNSTASTIVSKNVNANLITNLQEPPDYRRNRSPIDKQSINTNRLASPTKERLDNSYNNQRVKQLLDHVRNLENEPVSNNQNSTTVRSRLGGFNLPPSSTSTSLNDFGSQQPQQQWNTGIDCGTMNGLPFSTTSSQSNALLSTPNLPQSNRIFNANTFNDHPSSFPINDNSMFLNPIPQTNRFVVELRGLPNNVQTVDFQTFFRPVLGKVIDRDQIKLMLDDQALFHGVAHIFFNNELDLEKALLLNGRFIRDYPIEVLPVIQNALLDTPILSKNHVDFMGPMNFNNVDQSAVAYRNFVAGGGNGGGFNSGFNSDSFTRRRSLYPIFMKGIPFNSCNCEEVAKFFSNTRLMDIIIIQERSGRPTGNAYIILDSKDRFEKAMENNSKYMGKRYIELFPIQMNEIDNYKARIAYRNQRDSNHNDNGFSTFNRKRRRSEDRKFNNESFETIYCVQIKGLPPTVDNRDLTNFFLSFGVTASAVHIMLKQDGLNAGECFVEFKSIDSLNKALRLDGNRMDNNYILSIKEISYSKVRSMVGLDNQNSKFAKQSREDTVADRKSIVLASVSNKATVSDICAFFQDYDLQQNQVEIKLDRDGQRGNEVLLYFRNAKEADRVIRNLNHKYFIDKSIYLKHI